MRSRIYRRPGTRSAIFRVLAVAALIGFFYTASALAAGNDVRNSIVGITEAQVGKPYSMDMDKRLGPNYFDCSGLVWYSYTNSGVTITNKILDWTAYPIERSDVRPGDLVYLGYETNSGYRYPTGYHVGIYVGNGQVVDARGSASGVVKRAFDDLPWTWVGRVPARNWPAGDDGVAYSISDGDYVASLYEILLNREPASSEKDSWVSAMAGGETRFDVAREVTKSLEYCQSLVSGFYIQFLGRAPGAGELSGWADQVSNGQARIIDVRTAFLASSEYYGRVGSDPSAFVQSLYMIAFGRTPSPPETAGWASQIIDAASRTRVTEAIMNSDEARYVFITRTYYELLGFVDPSGLNTWLNGMRQSMDEPVVQSGMFSSSGFVNAYMNNKRFVTDLYRYFLGREPDANGLKLWTDAVNRGFPRSSVPSAFVNSTEHFYHVISTLYVDILKRRGEADGVYGWVRAMEAGMSPHVAEALFFGSQEYFIRLPDPSNRGYVQSLYRAILGRDPAGGEENGWVSLLDQGQSGRQSIAATFMGTYEHHYHFVVNCYQRILKRQPDASEILGWIRAMSNGVSEDAIEAGFFSSTEYKPIG